MRRLYSPQLILLALFLLAALIAFSPNLHSYFLSDDFVQIGKVLHGDYSIAWGREHGGFFRPLFIWSYVIDSCVWGANSFGYHLTNIILHGLNAFLVFNLARKLLEPLKLESRKLRIAAISAGALFLLHPSHAEAVVWISGRADLLATLFVLLSVLTFLGYEGSHRKYYLAASLGLFAIALLAKESAICTPLIILLIALFRHEQVGRALRAFAMFAAILIVFIGIRARVLGSLVGGYGTEQHLNFSPGWLRDRLLEAIVRSGLPPLPHDAFSFLFRPLQSPLFYLIACAFMVAGAGALVLRRRFYDTADRRLQNRFILMLVGLFLVALLPVINLRLYLYQTLGERFLYLPTVCACLLFAYVAMLLIRNATVLLICIAILLGFYSWSVYRTNLIWRDAANLSATLSAQLADRASSAPLVLLNVPDNLRGVPVFHNGLDEAVNWRHADRTLNEIQVVAFQDLQSATDENRIEGDDELTVRAVNPVDQFARVTSRPCVEVLGSEREVLKIQLRPCVPAAETLLYSSGTFNLLDVHARPQRPQ